MTGSRRSLRVGGSAKPREKAALLAEVEAEGGKVVVARARRHGLGEPTI